MSLRNFCRSFFLDCFGTFSSPKRGVHILNGHMLTRGTPDHYSVNAFRSQLEELSKYTRFINFEQATALILSGECHRVTEPLVAFSFDDGFDEGYLYLAPILEDYGVNAAFFINPNYVDGDRDYISNFNSNIVLTPGKRPMRWPQICELHKRGHIIGAHTIDHYMIASDNIEELRHQIVDCKEIIELKLGAECEYFAFPFGRLEHASELSIRIATEVYKYVYSQSDYQHYFSFNGNVINRRHFEPFWPVSHVKYFLDCRKS